jgi:hypothetical protein
MNEATTRPAGRVVRYPGLQRQIGDWLALASRSHTMHALVEVDVTDARRAIREWRAGTGEPLSLTAFVVSCLARAIAEDRRFHALRLGRDAPAARFALRLQELLEAGPIEGTVLASVGSR